MDRFKEAQGYFCLPPPTRNSLNRWVRFPSDCMDWMVEYIYENFDAVKLLICCAEGTKYENFIHEMVEIEVDYTHRFVAVLRGLGQRVPDIDSRSLSIF